MLDIDHCLFQPSLSSFRDQSEEIDSELRTEDRREGWQKLESTFDLLPGIPIIKLGYDQSR